MLGAVVFAMLLPLGGQLHGLADGVFLAGLVIEVPLGIVGQDRQAGHGGERLLDLWPVGRFEKVL